MQAQHFCWSMLVKSSVGRYLSNAVVKVTGNCWERTFNIAMIKYLRNGTFEKPFTITATEVFPLFRKKNKNQNTEYYSTFTSFKSHLCSKQGTSIFLLFGSWSAVLHLHVWVKSRLNDWAFVSDLSASGINSCYCHLKFRYCTCLG